MFIKDKASLALYNQAFALVEKAQYKESIILAVAELLQEKERGLLTIRDELATEQAKNNQLTVTITKAIETSQFYKHKSGDKRTLKFGYSRVIQELRRVN
ncbi:hypothetical protein HPQ32_13985 [Photobacterium carnosum]|uniref:hypothetical protein n=1 Tax=Photobacterium carnosum TaxID=2023717 RepID=UPI001C917250|nr:hypothetical protein [Photobacterium carnosum]MBY3789534.1 hypothetical protein [Photobacterium carnosum]MCD9534593.1 hypothetical protein [Photobacterium carnosum]